jgi:putative membrane protein
MKKIKLLAGILLTTFAFIGCDNASNRDSVDQAKEMNDEKADGDANTTMAVREADSKFMVDVANESMMEVEMGNVAQEKATDPQVKEFGAMMSRDHSKAADELRALAARKNVTMPGTMGEDMQKQINDMREKTGYDFDKDYMDKMVSHHKDAVDKFEKIANDNDADPDLKAWASTTLVTLRAHRDSADNLHKMIKDKK